MNRQRTTSIAASCLLLCLATAAAWCQDVPYAVGSWGEDGKGKGGFNPMNMMNKMPNPMNMFGGNKD